MTVFCASLNLTHFWGAKQLKRTEARKKIYRKRIKLITSPRDRVFLVARKTNAKLDFSQRSRLLNFQEL